VRHRRDVQGEIKPTRRSANRGRHRRQRLIPGIWQPLMDFDSARCARTNLPPSEVVAAANQDFADQQSSAALGTCLCLADPQAVKLVLQPGPPAAPLLAAQQVGKNRTSARCWCLKESIYDAGGSSNPGFTARLFRLSRMPDFWTKSLRWKGSGPQEAMDPGGTAKRFSLHPWGCADFADACPPE